MGKTRNDIPNRVPHKQRQGDASILSLPRDILSLITPYLALLELTKFSLSCSSYSHFFAPTIADRKDLLSAVMSANIERVQACLSKPSNIPMILTSMSAREFNGREWSSISPLLFAAWAGDQELVTLLLQHVSLANKPEALRQLESLMRVGGIQHGMPMKPFFDLSESYRIFSLHFENDIRLEAEGFCIKAIGRRQAELPSYGLQIFCDGERFTSESNKSDILYLEAKSKVRAKLGVDCFINKSLTGIFIDRRPTYPEAARHCEQLLLGYVTTHQNFLTQLIDQLRLEVPQPQPVQKKAKHR